MKKLAIIPARGGSKRIPRKNIRDFCGRPIISYSIEVARKSQLFDEVMVSTDDDEIAAIAINEGATVPFMRSSENSNDFATTADVIDEVISSYKKSTKEFDFTCCIYPTAPFIHSEALSEGFNKLVNEKRSTVFPIVEFSYSIWRGLKVEESGDIKMVWPEYLNSRSQDLEKVYHDAGQWYWLNNRLFKEDGNLFGSNSGYIQLNEMSVQDIDNESDWLLAELKYKLESGKA